MLPPLKHRGDVHTSTRAAFPYVPERLEHGTHEARVAQIAQSHEVLELRLGHRRRPPRPLRGHGVLGGGGASAVARLGALSAPAAAAAPATLGIQYSQITDTEEGYSQ